MDKNKITCSECNWKGHNKDVDKVKDPGGDDAWIICPACRTPEHLVIICDEDNCWNTTTCGAPTKDGYRHTCGKHSTEQNRIRKIKMGED